VPRYAVQFISKITMTMLNKEKDATFEFVLNQMRGGFNPKFMVTYHYRHPSEFGWRVIESVDTLREHLKNPLKSVQFSN
jgi:hypothetical protein